MAESVWTKTSCAFKDGTDEYGYANEYLTALRTNWRDNENGITRASGLIVGLAAVFELTLTKQAHASTFTFLGATLSNSAVIRGALPIIIAYLYYYITYSFIESRIFQIAHDAVINKVYPRIYVQDNERQLHPANSLVGSAERVKYALSDAGRPRARPARLGSATGRIRPAVIAITPPVFLAIAYSQLFVKYSGTFASIVSVVIAGILLIAGITNIGVAIRAVTAPRSDLKNRDAAINNAPSAPPA